MRRIIGHMVTRNERNRYLPVSIHWLRHLVDDMFVYDDQSDDGTYEFLHEKVVPAKQRPLDGTSFAEDESAFRSAAWREMEICCVPTPDDWILCIDADEFLLPQNSDGRSTRGVLRQTIRRAELADHTDITFGVAEVFDFADDGTPLVRTDAFWACIIARRLARWYPDATFPVRCEGGGSLPRARRETVERNELAVVHFGYARSEDRQAKYDRYRAGRGHNPRHVDSILRPPILRPWTGPMPSMGAPQ